MFKIVEDIGAIGGNNLFIETHSIDGLLNRKSSIINSSGLLL